MDSCINVITDMYDQVLELDSAITEFKKVTDLSGSALDSYIDKLTQAGASVARTGKPNRSEPVCWDGKPALRTAPKPLKASRALLLQHRDEICPSVIVGNQKDNKDDIWWKRLSIDIRADWARSPDEGCVNRIYRATLQ